MRRWYFVVGTADYKGARFDQMIAPTEPTLRPIASSEPTSRGASSSRSTICDAREPSRKSKQAEVCGGNWRRSLELRLPFAILDGAIRSRSENHNARISRQTP